MADYRSTVFQAATPSEALPDGHWKTARARSLYGACLVDLGQYREAEPLLTQAYETLVQERGASDHRAEAARRRLVTLYDAWGKPEEERTYRQFDEQR